MKPGECEIGIIGGTGGMGQWCGSLLRGQGYPVHNAGRRSGMPLEEMTRRCSVVIITVPIEETPSVIGRAGPLMREEALLMDLTSLKEAPLRDMLAATRAEVMGCHPLFGPQAGPLDDRTVVLCPGRVKRWATWPAEVFSAAGITVIETTAERHDTLMALVQGMNHLITILQARLIQESGIDRDELERCATPLFRSKLAIIDRVMGGNPRMYAEIITGNRHLPPLADRCSDILRELADLVRRGDAEGFARRIAGKDDFVSVSGETDRFRGDEGG